MRVLETGSHTVHRWLPASGEGLGALQAASPEPAPLGGIQGTEGNEHFRRERIDQAQFPREGSAS